MLAGGTHIDHVDVLRVGATQRVLPFRVMARSTIGAFLGTVRFGQVRQLDATFAWTLAEAWATDPGPGSDPLVADLDLTICDVHGAAKGTAGYGYTRVPGYHPLLATRAGIGKELFARMRIGSAYRSRGVVRFVDELLPISNVPPPPVHSPFGPVQGSGPGGSWKVSIHTRSAGQSPYGSIRTCKKSSLGSTRTLGLTSTKGPLDEPRSQRRSTSLAVAATTSMFVEPEPINRRLAVLDPTLVGPGDHLDRFDPVAVTGDRPKQIANRADQIRENTSITGIGRGASDAVWPL